MNASTVDGKFFGSPAPEIPDHEIVQWIAKGSFGDVWLARSILGEFRAVKVVRRDRFESDRPYQQEFAGIRTYAPISRTDPALLNILQIGKNDLSGYFYYIMEVADDCEAGQEIRPEKAYAAKTIQSVIHKFGRLPCEQVLNLAVALTHALEKLHARGLVHRDIKPANIIFVNEIPKLADIGSVAEAGKESMLGTLGFAAPEGPGTVLADLYSFGKVLYEISTGKDRGECPNPPTNLLDFPDREQWLELNEIICKACDSDPKKRYQSAPEMRKDLIFVQTGESVKRLRILERRAIWTKRIAILAVLLVGFGYFVVKDFAARALARQRELLGRNQSIRLTAHDDGWASLAQALVTEAARIRKGADVRNQAAANLAGLDAAALRQFPDSTFSVGDFSSVSGLVKKLGDPSTDPVSRDLWDRFPSEDKVVLSNPGLPSAQQESHLIHALNSVLKGGVSIYEMRRFTGVGLTEETRRLLAQKPKGGDLVRLNRSLIDSVYTAAIEKNYGVSSVVFDQASNRLLMSRIGSSAKLWDGVSDQFVVSDVKGTGIGAFRADGIPLQFAGQANSSIVVWDMAHKIAVRELRLDGETGVGRKLSSPWPMATLPDGSLFAACMQSSETNTATVVWETSSGKIVLRVPRGATALALSSAGALLATGDESGNIAIWSLSKGNQVANLKRGSKRIESLRFKPDSIRAVAHQFDDITGLLAAGDSGGAVTLWDLRTQSVRDNLRGSHYDVYALAFNPDGTLLAVGGRGGIRLWDVANARLLLGLQSADFVTDLNFSPDGKRLSASTSTEWEPGKVLVWDIQTGRGIDNLLGLSEQITKVAFSADGEMVAALAQDWEVGVWEVSRRRLKKVFLPSPGTLQADNAAIALSPDGRLVAFAAGTSATIWETDSGRELGPWKIPDGYADQLLFCSPNKLILFRAETQSSTGRPFQRDPVADPLVCRIRDLLGPRPTEPIAEIRELNWHLYGSRASPAGKFIVADGLHVQNGEQTRIIIAFDALSGSILWTKVSVDPRRYASLAVDPLGKIVTLRTSADASLSVVEARSGTLSGTIFSTPSAIGPDLKFWTRSNPPETQGRGISVFAGGSKNPLVTFTLDSMVAASATEFTAAGNILAWGNIDGSISLCDLRETRRRLTQVGVMW